MKIFYHSVDNDGKCSGYLIYNYEKNVNKNNNIECIGINYGEIFPITTILSNEKVYIVDYSILPSEMTELLEITQNVIWIDHHKTAIEKYSNFSHDIAGLRYDGIAASMLTYCYLQTNKHINEPRNYTKYEEYIWKRHIDNAPLFIKYMAAYDVWNFGNKEEEIKAFTSGTYLMDLLPTSTTWEVLYDESNVQEVIKNGRLLTKYNERVNENLCKFKGFEVEWLGYKCFVLNKSGSGTDTFKSLDSEQYEIYIGFSYNGSIWTYSLRSGFNEKNKEIDVSEIAKRFGGGGHKYAAGFETKECIF